MRFVASGPDIPVEVLTAQQDGTLIFFCGAGVSMPAGLPNFKGLVDSLISDLYMGGKPANSLRSAEIQSALSPNSQLMTAHRKKEYDHFIGLLCREFSRTHIVEKVKKYLGADSPVDLKPHQNIVRLATDSNGICRIVTTNFDELFELAEPSVPVRIAPALPVPKADRLKGIVHIHGAIHDPNDPAGDELVLSRADFGRAYLTERWASIFLSQLFTRFTVVLLGYSLDDPILKYMVDALAADKEAKQVYAFAPFDHKSSEERVIEEWDSKGVRAIPYNQRYRHKLLYQSLGKWADYWAGGLGGKAQVVRNLGTYSPNSLSQEDIDLLCHAISESDGSMVRKLQERHSEVQERETEESNKLEKLEQWYGWLEQFIVHGLVREEAIAGVFRFSPIELTQIERQLCCWLVVFHLDNPKLMQRVMNRGGLLHPEFRDIIRGELIYRDLWGTAALFPFWFHLVTDTCSFISTDDFTGYAVSSKFATIPWNKGSSILFRNLMMTRLHLRPAWSFGIEESDENRKAVDGDIVLLHGDFKDSWEKVSSREDITSIAPYLLHDATAALLRIFDLLLLIEKVAPKEDLIYISRPSIAEHPQNHDHDHWLLIIDVLRDLHDLMDAENPSIADNWRRQWASIEFPLFKRLAMYGVTHSRHMDANSKIDWLLGQGDWFWRVSVQHEVYELLKATWADLDATHQKQLVANISTGAPRELFREDLDEDDWERIKDRETYDLFHFLQHYSKLRLEAVKQLDAIQVKYPEWRAKEIGKAGFPTWSESGWGWDSECTTESLLAMKIEERVNILSGDVRDREGMVRQWEVAVRTSPSEAINTLKALAEVGYYGEDIWKWSLFGFADIDPTDPIWDQLIGLLDAELENLPAQAACAISRGIKNITPTASGDRLDQLLPLIEGLLPIANAEAEIWDDHVHSAINHASGQLTEALVDLLASRSPKANELLPPDLRPYFDLIVSGQGNGFHLGRVILASRLYFLYAVDPAWTRNYLLPFFDWGSSESIGLWQGYLWGPRLSPDLFNELKVNYLKAFEHLEEFGREKDNLAYLLGNILADYDEAITPAEVHHPISMLDERERGLVVSVFSERLMVASKKPSGLWEGKYKEILLKFWPRETGLQGEWTSRFLAQVAINSGDDFADAVQTLLPLIGSSEQSGIALEDIEKNGLAKEYPKATLDLISKLISSDCRRRRIVDNELPRLLAELIEAQPELEHSPLFIRLNELVIRGG